MSQQNKQPNFFHGVVFGVMLIICIASSIASIYAGTRIAKYEKTQQALLNANSQFADQLASQDLKIQETANFINKNVVPIINGTQSKNE